LCSRQLRSDISAGTLSGTFTALPSGSNVNLSVTGPADWIHWGRLTVDSANRKAGVVQQIDTFGVVGEDLPFQFTNVVDFPGATARRPSPLRTP